MVLEKDAVTALPGQLGGYRWFDFYGQCSLGGGFGECDLVLFTADPYRPAFSQFAAGGTGILCDLRAISGDAGLDLESGTMVIDLSLLRHFTYLFMEAYIIGGVAFVLWAFHFRALWRLRYRILLGVLTVLVYALPMDALAVRRGWGGFNPAFITGITFFGGALHLEEIVFWLGTSFVTLSAVMLFAELEDRGVPWWALPAGVILPIGLMISIFPNQQNRD